MPSQEDYLDSLLKELTSGLDELENIEDETISADEGEMFSTEDTAQEVSTSFTDVNSAATMSEAEIERLLAGSMLPEEDVSEFTEPEDNGIAGLMGILKATDDEDLQDIHDLLQKSDQNEAVDEDIMSLLQKDDADLSFDPLEEDSEESEESVNLTTDEKMAKVEERRRAREEKKAEKRAKKAAAKAEKLAQKAAKKAEKTGKSAKASKAINEETLLVEETSVAEALPQEEIAGLDELLSLTGGTTFETQEQEAAETSFEDIFGTASTEVSDNAADLVDVISEREEIAHKKEKKGFFAKILDFITEEEEEDSEDAEIKLSDENKNILDELDKNKKKNKKAKKGKKGAKNNQETPTEGEEDSSEKGKKSKKEKKPKKEKAPKLTDDEQESTGSKLSIKRILPIFLICISVGGVIILAANISSDYSAKKIAQEAYYNADYQTCYQNLFGKDLNESEQVMFSKSESILRIRLWIREYAMLAADGLEAEALDSLIQSVNAYPALYDYSSQWNAGTEVSEIYAQMLSILNGKYHLTEEQALWIASAEDDIEYSRIIYSIINANASSSGNEPASGTQDTSSQENQNEVLNDILPEEEELKDITFVESD